MKRRRFLAGISAVLLLGLGCQAVAGDQEVLHVINSWNQSATILIPGLKTNLKLMQITDAHISVSVDRETNMTKYAERMHKAYTGSKRHFNQDTTKTTFEYLDDVLQKAKKGKRQIGYRRGGPISQRYDSAGLAGFQRLGNRSLTWWFVIEGKRLSTSVR